MAVSSSGGKEPVGQLIFLVYHVSHQQGAHPARHHGEDGEVAIDPTVGDDVKLLGCYSTAEKAAWRIERARELPGFRDEPKCFVVSSYVIDRDEWTEGFELVP